MTAPLRVRLRRWLSGFSAQRKLHMPVLETERLVLRKFVSADLDAIASWEDAANSKLAMDEARRFLAYCFGEYERRGIGPWAMQLKGSGEVAGNCGYPHIHFDEKCGEVNYYVGPRYRGNGLALEGLKALLQFGFRDLGLDRVQARCDPDNIASERVMQKAGMKFERLAERAAPSAQSTADHAPQKLYAILAKEFNLR